MQFPSPYPKQLLYSLEALLRSGVAQSICIPSLFCGRNKQIFDFQPKLAQNAFCGRIS